MSRSHSFYDSLSFAFCVSCARSCWEKSHFFLLTIRELKDIHTKKKNVARLSIVTAHHTQQEQMKKRIALEANKELFCHVWKTMWNIIIIIIVCARQQRQHMKCFHKFSFYLFVSMEKNERHTLSLIHAHRERKKTIKWNHKIIFRI